MHRSLYDGPHLEKIDADAALRELPGGLAPREAAPDNGHARFHAVSAALAFSASAAAAAASSAMNHSGGPSIGRS